MKAITFYNEKGGVGKSSFGIMYASWLRYKMGIKSAMADFNNRIMSERKNELKRRGKQEPEDMWPIATVSKKELAEYTNLGIELPRCKWLHDVTERKEFADTEVLIIDLPGSTEGLEPQEIMYGKYLSLVIMPTDRDLQTVRATIYTKKLLKSLNRNNIRIAAFINEVQMFMKKSEFIEIAKIFKELDIDILPSMIQYSERMKKSKGNNIMKSTLSYPDWDSPEFKGSRDLGIENLFVDVTRLLAQAPDIPGTRPTDLTGFAAGLRKDTSMQALNKQLNGTVFTELEIPLPEEMKEKFWKNR